MEHSTTRVQIDIAPSQNEDDVPRPRTVSLSNVNMCFFFVGLVLKNTGQMFSKRKGP